MHRLSLIILIYVAGCMPNGHSPSSEASVATLESPILNGQADYTTNHVVGIETRRPEGRYVCSGTLITKNLVLTAYHCITKPRLN
jgi:hypothetical protein